MLLSKSQQRDKYITFVLLVTLCFVLIVYQKNRPAVIETNNKITLRLLSPILKSISFIESKTGSVFSTVFSFNNFKKDFETLSKENTSLKIRLKEIEEENRRLKGQIKVIDGVKPFNYTYSIVQIIALNSSPWKRLITIDKGYKDGMKVNLPVINQKGLVGIIRQVDISTSLVELLIDEKFAVSAITKKTGIYGIAKGTGDFGIMNLMLEDENINLEIGEEVITSGLDNSLFPKGITIGVISKRERTKYGNSEYSIKPAVNVNQLEFLLVILDPTKK